MIIYNKIWLANRLVRAEAEKAHKANMISLEELKKVEERYPVGFYSPNIFIRIGLFLLTCIIVSFSIGLLSLILGNLSVLDSWGYFLFLGAVTYIALEVMVKNSNHFKSGVDDALMWISGGLILTAYIWALDTGNLSFSYSLFSFFIFLLSLYYLLRYADMLMAAVSSIAFVATIFFVWKDLSSLGIATMPFLMMFTGAAIYLASRKNVGKKLTIHYTNSLQIIQIIGLLVLYLGGNYYVVQTLGAIANGYESPDVNVPFGFFFWTWTVLVPFFYICAGLLYKDVIVLRTGLLLVAAAAFTFRNYYHVMPIEGVLCIIGAALLGLSYIVIKYLTTPKHGFTYEDLDEDTLADKLKIESLIVAETFSDSPLQAENSRFGGGDFGGGGASGNF